MPLNPSYAQGTAAWGSAAGFGERSLWSVMMAVITRAAWMRLGGKFGERGLIWDRHGPSPLLPLPGPLWHLHLHPLHRDHPEQGCLLRRRGHEVPGRAFPAQFWHRALLHPAGGAARQAAGGGPHQLLVRPCPPPGMSQPRCPRGLAALGGELPPPRLTLGGKPSWLVVCVGVMLSPMSVSSHPKNNPTAAIFGRRSGATSAGRGRCSGASS